MTLPIRDPRREAWLAEDRLSSQWVSSWPTARDEISPDEMPEVLCTYLGCESRVVRPYAGAPIPCGASGARGRVCDAYGHQLGLAALPGGFEEAHDGCGTTLMRICITAGIAVDIEPRHIFTSLIPPAVLLAPGGKPGAVPDATIDVALPRATTARHAHQPRDAQPRRRLMVDVKTLHGGGAQYHDSARAREDQLSTRQDGERARAREPRRTSPAPLVSTSSSLASGSTGKTVT